MKFVTKEVLLLVVRRPPYGGRGLKCAEGPIREMTTLSPPVWGAWIEIAERLRTARVRKRSPPVWGAWIEIA